MNGFEIASHLSANKTTKTFFKGVFAADQLAHLQFELKEKSIVIANIQPSKYSGLHWIAFYISPSVIEFMDSGGQTYAQNKYFKEFISKIRNKKNIIIRYINQPLQHLFSSICGQYCIVYALMRSKNMSLYSFLKIFKNSKSTLQNDAIIMNYFEKYFSKNKIIFDKKKF